MFFSGQTAIWLSQSWNNYCILLLFWDSCPNRKPLFQWGHSEANLDFSYPQFTYLGRYTTSPSFQVGEPNMGQGWTKVDHIFSWSCQLCFWLLGSACFDPRRWLKKKTKVFSRTIRLCLIIGYTRSPFNHAKNQNNFHTDIAEKKMV